LQVFKVKHIETGKILAAKIINKDKLEENKHKDKFVVIFLIKPKEMLINEMEVLRDCQHENIIRLEEIYQEQDSAIYVMEYLKGGEVYSRLKKNKRFSEKESARILFYMTRGLKCIHDKKIVH
jgi:calcium-dependent protein kinase